MRYEDWIREMSEALRTEHDGEKLPFLTLMSPGYEVPSVHWLECHTPTETCPVLPGDTLIRKAGQDL